MSRCWDVENFCSLVVFVAGVHVVEFGSPDFTAGFREKDPRKRDLRENGTRRGEKRREERGYALSLNPPKFLAIRPTLMLCFFCVSVVFGGQLLQHLVLPYCPALLSVHCYCC